MRLLLTTVQSSGRVDRSRCFPQLNGRICSRINSSQIARIDLHSPDQVRCDEKYDLLMLNLMLLRAEQVFEAWYFSQSRSTTHCAIVLFLEKATKKVALSLLETNRFFNALLTDDRLGDTADCRRAVLRRNFYFHFETDVAVIVDRRLHLYVHANIDVLELRVHKRTGRRSSCGGKRSGRNRDSLADLQRSLLSIGRAQARILQYLRVTVRQQHVGNCRTDSEREVLRSQIGKVIECQRSAGCSARGYQRCTQRLWPLKADITYFVPINLQHGNIDHYFWSCFIQVIDE